MDKLVRSGVTFTNTHIMGSYSGAVCMPSRAMLFTSKNLFNLERSGSVIPDEDITMGECLKNSGYNTFGTGKWHNSREAYARTFTAGANIFFGGMCNHYQVPIYDFDSTGEYPKANKTVGKKFSSELFTDAAVDYIENYNEDKPFFVYVAYTAPHDPRIAPKEYTALYEEKNIDIPENYMPEHPFDNGELKIRDEKLAPFPRTKEIVKKEMAAYYAMISNVDDNFKRLRGLLQKLNIEDNTIFIFMTDNGTAAGYKKVKGEWKGYNANMRGTKASAYEGGHRVPLLIRYAKGKIKGGKDVTELSSCIDLLPTIAKLCNLDAAKADGCDLSPLLKGKKKGLKRKYIISDSQRVQEPEKWRKSSVMSGTWRLVNGEELYDISKDPGQEKDVAQENPDQVKIMRSYYDELVENVDFSALFADFAGVDYPESMQGRSFRSVLKGNTPKDWRDYSYYHYWENEAKRPAHIGLRGERYKLAFYYGKGLLNGTGDAKLENDLYWDFFDLDLDPNELHNAYNDSQYQKIISDMKLELLRKKTQLGDNIDENPEIRKVITEHWN
jgi:arylsulfatase A-like enzyme